jgi:hypothetical protein|tara:strand:+ start:11247 stop:11438 length:192 start_codon:yes stop_codon:yes gene_type:complete
VASKTQRQNQHVKRLEKKIGKFEKKGKPTERLKKELGYMMGESRPEFKTGRDVDPRLKKAWKN